ncbi:TCTEX1 domain-containing protein 2-like [Plakobranchus ocellatus]|uniref:TCTEX1 domain-containing protein 2-like n=1 Tax=Plakobranchus ocellatus TaxID=259542 RepID=A0AAV3Z6R8_9GAST|nr:TCTEX1 domain-containing protein 2-like [Plakobranchus ocellatus]
MATTGSHPAVKLKKTIQFPQEVVNVRRPSNCLSQNSQPESSSTLGVEAAGPNMARRRSTKYGGGTLLTAAHAFRRMTRNSIAQEQLPKPVVKYENTYKLGPDEGTEFFPSKAKNEIEVFLEQHMRDVTYDPSTAAQLTQTIADKVKNLTKELNCPRYKVVSTVVVGECKNQGLETASRCLWDDGKDNFATVCHKNKTIFAVVTVFAVYFE